LRAAGRSRWRPIDGWSSKSTAAEGVSHRNPVCDVLGVGINAIDMAQAIRLDDFYTENWSLTFGLYIFLRTLRW
jgi:lipopolysaccharide/colanic/teichoic acid biosynthesis glycosyltransferase